MALKDFEWGFLIIVFLELNSYVKPISEGFSWLLAESYV